MDTGNKAWIEWRSRWLVRKLGLNRVQHCNVILPTEEFFPEKYDATPDCARRLLDQIGIYLDVETKPIRLEVCRESEMPDAAGMYCREHTTVIRIADSQLIAPMRLVATLTHELGHEVLLGRGWLTDKFTDHELNTDLLSVFCGMGIFGANATVFDNTVNAGAISWWEISRQGYLSSIQIGYALALFAYIRREEQPPWANFLRNDARATFNKGLNYLLSFNDSLVGPEMSADDATVGDLDHLVSVLTKGTSSARLAALWDITELGRLASSAVANVARCLSDEDPSVAIAAAYAIAEICDEALIAQTQLLGALDSTDDRVIAATGLACGGLGIQPEVVVPRLVELLQKRDQRTMPDLINALKLFRTAARPAVQILLDLIRDASISCHLTFGDYRIDALLAIEPDFKNILMREFAIDHPEILEETMKIAALIRNNHISASNQK